MVYWAVWTTGALWPCHWATGCSSESLGAYSHRQEHWCCRANHGGRKTDLLRLGRGNQRFAFADAAVRGYPGLSVVGLGARNYLDQLLLDLLLPPDVWNARSRSST